MEEYVEDEIKGKSGFIVKEKISPKIRRIALKQSGIVEIIRIESPSSFFVRPINHIRDLLVYREPLKLEKLENGAIGDFALAPIEERTLGRCMILNKYNDHSKVFFIDEAVTAFVADECVFQIDPVECEFPWQVIHVSLGKVQSLAEGGWNDEQCEIFRNIISKFDTFEIVTCEYEMSKDINRSTVLGVLFGLDEKMRKVSIENIFASLCPDIDLTIFPRNLFENPSIWDLDVEDDVDGSSIEEFRRKLPADWQWEKTKYWKEMENEWNIEECNMKCLKELIGDFETSKNTVFGFIEYGKNESPMDTFIRFLKPREQMDSDAFIEDFDEMEEFNEMLNRFYQKKINQKLLSLEEISSKIAESRMIAICNMVSSHNGHNSRWMRVEILNLLGESAEVRFIDAGGTSLVRLRYLHRIYKPHTLKPQYCFHISFPMFYEVENNERYSQDLSTESKQLWVSLLRYDVPVEIRFVEVNDSNIVIGNDIRFIDTNESLCEDFVSKSNGKIVKLVNFVERFEESSKSDSGNYGRKDCSSIVDCPCTTSSDVTV